MYKSNPIHHSYIIAEPGFRVGCPIVLARGLETAFDATNKMVFENFYHLKKHSSRHF